MNKLTKLQATPVQNYESPTFSLTGVKCSKKNTTKNPLLGTVDCRSLGLTKVPGELPADTKEL